MPLPKLLEGFVVKLSIGASLIYPLPSFAANLAADYQFQNTLSSTVAGAPDLVDLGSSNTFSTATVDGQSTTVFNFAEQTGLQLSTSSLIPNNTYSVVTLFSFAEVSGYRKILDFKAETSDDGLYNLDSDLVFFPIAFPSGSPIGANNYVQVVLTRAANDEVTGYVNGVQQFSFSDSGQLGVISGANLLNFFRDDLETVGSESSAGSVARIRLYDDALSSAEVAVLDLLPAIPTTVPEPSSLLGILVIGGLVAGSQRKRKA